MDMDESGPVEFTPPEERAKRGLKMVYANGVVVNHVDWGESNAVQFIGTEGKVEISRSFLRTFPNEGLAKAKLLLILMATGSDLRSVAIILSRLMVFGSFKIRMDNRIDQFFTSQTEGLVRSLVVSFSV
jgi:hypothetical protein